MEGKTEALAEIATKTVIEAERNPNHSICKMVINKEDKKKEKLTERNLRAGKHR